MALRRRFDSANRSESKINTLGIIFILGGLAVVLLALYVDAILPTPVPLVWQMAIDLCRTLGIAAVSLGAIGIIVNLPDWQEYFKKRLGEIIVKRDYLRTLGREELADLQIQTMKAFFDVDEIDQAGSFLSHFEREIRQYIASPYRDHCNLVLTIIDDDDPRLFKVDDSLTYVCRGLGDRIQPSIDMIAEANELYDIGPVEVILEVPEEREPPKSDFDATDGDGRQFRIIDQKFEKEGRQFVYRLPLKDFEVCDGLTVSVRMHYKVRRDRFLSWGASHVTKGFSYTIRYPERLEVEAEYFGLRDTDVLTHRAEGMIHFRCDKWILPFSGIVVELAEPLMNDEEGGDPEVA